MKKSFSSVMFAAVNLCAAFHQEAWAQNNDEPVAPPSGEFAVEKITAMGTGCPNSVTAEFTPNGETLVLGFATGELVASVAPCDREPPVSRTCQVVLDLRIPVDYRMAIGSAVYQGYAGLESDVVGRHMTRYWFLGTRAPARFAELSGPHFGPYNLESDFGAEAVSSLCNLDKPLHIQTTIAVSNLRNPSGRGFISVGGPETITYGLIWRRCSP